MINPKHGDKMPKIQTVEKKIFEIELVNVKFIKDGQDVRGDKIIPTQYNFDRMLKNSASVKDLITKRLQKKFPGYDFEVLKQDGSPASGQTKLSTVRDTYLDEE